jgi:hypothetical protein
MWKWINGLPPMSKMSLAAACAAMCAVAAMNVYFGITIGASSIGKAIYSYATFVCAVAGTIAFGLLAGHLVKKRRFFAATFASLILVIAVVFEMASTMGFTATERLSSVAMREELIAADQQAKKLRQSSAEKLIGIATVRGPGISRAQRKEFIEAASAEIDKVGAPSEVMKILPDAQAEMIAKVFGWVGYRVSVSEVQLGLIAYLSVLLILIHSSGFFFTTFLVDRAMAASNDDDSSAAGGSGGDKRIHKTDKLRVVGSSGLSPSTAALAAANTSLSAPGSVLGNWRGERGDKADKPRMPFDQYDALLRNHAKGLLPPMSQRKLAELTGRTQSAVCQRLIKIERQLIKNSDKPSPDRRFMDIGGSYHAPACI